MGACVGSKIPQQRNLIKKQYTFERGTVNMKLEVESNKGQTAQTDLIQTIKTPSQPKNLQQNRQIKTKKNASHLQNSQYPSAREMRLSQLVSDIQNQLRTQSLPQTIDNIFLRTLQSQVNPFDQRHSIKQTHIYPYNCIGMLFYSIQGALQNKNREYFYFTAFLIAPNIIMSSACTMIRYLQGNQTIPLKFMIRQSENQSLQNIFSKARLISNIFNQSSISIVSAENIRNSYCLFQLQNQVKRQKYLPLACQFNIEAEVQIYGFPMHNLILENQKGDRQNLYGMKGQAKVYQNCIQYDIYTSSGQQGAPILYSPIQGEFLVIGIHSGYVGREESFQKNSHILDMLELNSHMIKKQARLNTGTLITRQILTQLKRWSNQCVSMNRIQFINCYNLTSDIYKSQIKLTKVQKLNHLNDAKLTQFLQFDAILIRYIQKAQKYYSKWQPHTSIHFCGKALQQLNNSNQYFLFKINFILALNYRLLVQLQITLLYFTKCYQYLIKINNKSIQHYILFVDLYSNLSITYLQNKAYLQAKICLRKAQQIVKKFDLFQHNANVALLMTKGIIQKQTRLIENALKHFQEALKIYQKTKSSNVRVIERQRLVCIQQNIADCYYIIGNLQVWAMTGLQCIKQLYDIDLISRIFQIEWFQNFLMTLSKEKINLSIDCQFRAARILSSLFEKSISITSERFKKDFLSNLRMIKRESIRNLEQ